MRCDVLNILNFDVISATEVGHFKFMEIQFCPAWWFLLVDCKRKWREKNSTLGAEIATASKLSAACMCTILHISMVRPWTPEHKSKYVRRWWQMPFCVGPFLFQFSLRYIFASIENMKYFRVVNQLQLIFIYIWTLHIAHKCSSASFRTFERSIVCNVCRCCFVDTYLVNSQTHTHTHRCKDKLVLLCFSSLFIHIFSACFVGLSPQVACRIPRHILYFCHSQRLSLNCIARHNRVSCWTKAPPNSTEEKNGKKEYAKQLKTVTKCICKRFADVRLKR